MKAVIVRYTVKAAFADDNQRNIERVMAEMRERADDGIRYQAFRVPAADGDEGVRFVHFGMYADDAAVDRMTSVESFKAFQAALKGSGPLSPPKAEWLDRIGSSYPLFD